jgi:hypothetical protein
MKFMARPTYLDLADPSGPEVKQIGSDQKTGRTDTDLG